MTFTDCYPSPRDDSWTDESEDVDVCKLVGFYYSSLRVSGSAQIEFRRR